MPVLSQHAGRDRGDVALDVFDKMLRRHGGKAPREGDEMAQPAKKKRNAGK